MARFAKFWPSFVSAALLLLAFPPFSLGMLVFVALVPWLSSLGGKSAKEGFKSGYLFGCFFMGGQLVWLAQFVGKWTQSWLMGLVPFLLAVAITSLFFGLLGLLMARARFLGLVWAIPLLWAGVEIVRTYIPGLAFPWGLIHTPLYPFPGFLQLGYFATSFATSAWIVLANVVGMLMMEKAQPHLIRTYAIAFLGLGLLSWVRYGTPATGDSAKVILIQPGIDMAFGDRTTEFDRIRRDVGRQFALAKLHNPDLIVLPEGLTHVENGGEPELPFAVEGCKSVLLGASRRTNEGTYQSAVGYDGEWKSSDKRRLVVFGEYVPFREFLPFLQSFSLPSGDLVPSDSTRSMKLGNLHVGPLLCFEGLFPDVASDQARNGAQLLAILSIDDWYMGTTAPEQLAAASVFRAIETGLPVVRAASMGHTLAVDQRGNLTARAPLHDPAMLQVNLVVRQSPDFNPFGFVFGYLAIGSMAFVEVAARLRVRRSPGVDSSSAKATA